jgi:23S rRNA (cytidine1920-2'-O)/16S rRNA (cytidine1409-2'-O)-methyltransferase
MAKQRLDARLAEKGLAENRSKAGALIMTGRVLVDGKRVDKAGYFVTEAAKITITPGSQYVSRAGGKLASVANKLELDFRGKVMLDVGSSTGGFTDYALQSGAKRVYAVDVGTQQLDWKLRTDERVVVMEKTDIRDVKPLPEPIDLVVIDVSFISLKLVLPAVRRLVGESTPIIAMAKPHFEADRRTASMHKGVIKNDTIRRGILKNLEEWLRQNNFIVRAKADSEVAGMKGNVERFYLLH